MIKRIIGSFHLLQAALVLLLLFLSASGLYAQTPDFTAVALDEFGQPVDTLKANPGDVVYLEIQGLVSPTAYWWGAVMVEVSSAQILSVEESYDYWHSGMGLWWTDASEDPTRGGAGSLYYYNHIHSEDNDVYKSEGSSWATAYALNNPEPFLAGPAGSIYNPADPILPSSARFYYSGYLGNHSITRPGIRIGLRIQDALSLTVKISNHTRFSLEWIDFEMTNEVEIPVAPRENHQSVHTEGNNVWIQVSGPASAKVGDTVTVSTYGELMNDSWLYNALLERTDTSGITTDLIRVDNIVGNEFGPETVSYQVTTGGEEICDGTMQDIGSIPELERQTVGMTFPVIPDLPEIIGPPTIEPSIDFNGLTVISKTAITETVTVSSNTVNVEVTVTDSSGNVVATATLPASNGTATGPITLPPDSPDGYYTFTQVAVNDAGRSGGYTHSVKLDLAPPAIYYSITPAPNANGWNNTPVTVRFWAIDGESGASWNPAEVTINAEGIGLIAGPCTAIDGVGNESLPLSVFVNIDWTKPEITYVIAPGPNAYGWNNTDVNVTFSATDNLSGIDGEPTYVDVLSDEGAGQISFWFFFDKAGNMALKETAEVINIDKTPPVVDATLDRAPYWKEWYKDDVTITFKATDNLSGIDGPDTKVEPVNEEGRAIQRNWQVTDKAGNKSNNKVVKVNIDKSPPVFTKVPEPIIREQTTHDGVPSRDLRSWLDSAQAKDIYSGLKQGYPKAINVPDFFPLGVTTVTFEAIDNVDRKTTKTSTVTVKDRQPPVITVKDPLIVAATEERGTPRTNLKIQEWLNSATAVDICDPDVKKAEPYKVPNYFNIGNNTVTFRATDRSGNIGYKDATVTVFEVKMRKCPPSFFPRGGKEDNTTFITALVNPSSVKGKFRFILYAVSSEPGYCMNAPQTVPASGEDSPDWSDLQFPKQDGFTITGDNNLAETKKSDLSSATVTIKCYDYGAYGKINAVFFYDGQIIAAREDDGTRYYTNIPRDDDDNYIRDASAQNSGPTGNAPGNDNDNTPAPGTGGDGLTRYEEWRGFIVKGKHTRTSVTQKDIFIYNQDQKQLELDYFLNLGLKVREINKDEFNGTASRIVNKNSSSRFHLVDQHGLWLVNGGTKVEGYWGIAEGIINFPSSPGQRTRIVVYRDQIRSDIDGWCPPGGLKRFSDFYRYIVAHELGHGVAIWHHGPSGGGGETTGNEHCVMRYIWDKISVGKTSAANWNAIVIPYTYCNNPPDNCRSDVDVNDY